VASTISDSAREGGEDDNEEKEKVEKKGVFVNRDGLARFVEVETGINDQQNYEVLAGLEEDDEVIVGSFRVLRTIADSTSIKVDNRRFGGENSQ
jgi:HlyD family secretion protein